MFLLTKIKMPAIIGLLKRLKLFGKTLPKEECAPCTPVTRTGLLAIQII